MKNETNREFPDLIKAGLKVGDKVYSYLYGDGVVTSLENEGTFKITVSFNLVNSTFTEYGYEYAGQILPSIHLQPWNPVAGEPFPFPKFEPIVGEQYGFWGNNALKDILVYATFARKIADKFEIQESEHVFTYCAPIKEALRIFGFNKVGEVEP